MLKAATPTVHPISEELRRDLLSIEGDVLTGYTLADAMREGASRTRQLTGDFVTRGATCALGAAFLSANARGYV